MKYAKVNSLKLLQQDYARVHTCKVAVDAVERNGYELIPYPAYSPELAPSDFFLFPNLKKDFRGCHFRSDEEVVTAVEKWINRVSALEGNYIEKEEVALHQKC